MVLRVGSCVCFTSQTPTQYFKKTANLSINANRLYKCIPTYKICTLIQNEPPLLCMQQNLKQVGTLADSTGPYLHMWWWRRHRCRAHLSLALPVNMWIACQCVDQKLQIIFHIFGFMYIFHFQDCHKACLVSNVYGVRPEYNEGTFCIVIR